MTNMPGEHNVITTFNVDPCEATWCAMQSKLLTVCVDHRCPYHWQRETSEVCAGGRCDTDCRASKTAMKGEGEGGIR